VVLYGAKLGNRTKFTFSVATAVAIAAAEVGSSSGKRTWTPPPEIGRFTSVVVI